VARKRRQEQPHVLSAIDARKKYMLPPRGYSTHFENYTIGHSEPTRRTYHFKRIAMAEKKQQRKPLIFSSKGIYGLTDEFMYGYI